MGAGPNLSSTVRAATPPPRGCSPPGTVSLQAWRLSPPPPPVDAAAQGRSRSMRAPCSGAAIAAWMLARCSTATAWGCGCAAPPPPRGRGIAAPVQVRPPIPAVARARLSSAPLHRPGHCSPWYRLHSPPWPASPPLPPSAAHGAARPRLPPMGDCIALAAHPCPMCVERMRGRKAWLNDTRVPIVIGC